MQFLPVYTARNNRCMDAPPTPNSQAYFCHAVKQRAFSNDTLTNNTLTSAASQFSFIIPYDQTQACDIYGPLCQTGSITVGVDLTSKTTSTVLPCSSYLSAQSSFLGPLNIDDESWPAEWATNFGHSPECHSYARAFDKGQYTASNCGSHNPSVIPVASQGLGDSYPVGIPPGVIRYWTAFEFYSCCGNCTLQVPEIRLLYFPDSTTTECHLNQTSNSSSILSTGKLGKRVQSLIADGSIAVVSGHTLYVRPYVFLCL